jgi:hypothetical protein
VRARNRPIFPDSRAAGGTAGEEPGKVTLNLKWRLIVLETPLSDAAGEFGDLQQTLREVAER